MPVGERQTVKARSNGTLISAISEFLTSEAESVLVAPTHSAGEELAHRAGQIAGVHRVTLLQLALEWARGHMARLGLAPLTGLGAEALSARIVYESRKELTYFHHAAGMSGFPRALARTISDLRMARIRPEELEQRGASGPDLAELLSRYESEIQSLRLADSARVYELALQGSSSWAGLPVALLDLPELSAAQQDFLNHVTAQASKVFYAIRQSDAEETEPRSLIDHLRVYLFSENSRSWNGDEPFEIFSAPGEGLEAVEIARRILRLSRDGVRFDQIAILLRTPERYQPMVEDALRRARIPAYFSRGTARPDPGGRAFLALLACAIEKCSASRFAEYLSLGQVPQAGAEPSREWVPPSDEMIPSEPFEAATPEVDESRVARAPAAWEKMLTDAAVIGGRERWSRRLAGLEHEFELRLKTIAKDDETRRQDVARRLDQLRDLERFALPLIDMLHSLPKSAMWRDWIERLSELARTALRQPEPILAVLAEFAPMADVGPAEIEEVASVLSERLRFLRRDPPQRRYGRVFVASIDEARGREFGIVFLPGLAEGLFPQRATEDPLLLDECRPPGLRVREDKTRDERERLQLACAAARDQLIASYPRMDVAEARPRVPSFYALELPRAIDGRLPRLQEFEQKARDRAPARLNWPAPKETADAIDDAEYDLVVLARHDRTARYLVESNECLARSLRARYRRWEHSKWSESDGLITRDLGVLSVLEQNRLKAKPWSPSSLQLFAACPYRFALHGIFGIRPREEAAPIEQLDPLTRGGIFHAVQFALLNKLRDRKLLPVSPKNLPEVCAIADQALDEAAQQYREDLAPAIDRVWTSEIEDIRTDLRGWLQYIAVNDDDWMPVHFEFAFGLAADPHRDAESTAEVAELDGVLLRGSIDLVERHVARGALRVTDHKTGKIPETTPFMVGGGKFLQPLLYGIAAEKLLNSQVECGRLFYATQKGAFTEVPITLDHRSRQFLAKLLSNIDAAIADGFLPAAPQKDSCEQCDYREVCGPYEERRFGKKDRHDERLQGLIEVRGMA
jgi:CRISPR/Cas system-associated exonuclease Cas4 (RecB family)